MSGGITKVECPLSDRLPTNCKFEDLHSLKCCLVNLPRKVNRINHLTQVVSYFLDLCGFNYDFLKFAVVGYLSS